LELGIYVSKDRIQIVEPNAKRPKKKAKKAAVEVQPAAPPARVVQPDKYPSGCDEENLVDYDEVEEPCVLQALTHACSTPRFIYLEYHILDI
jgi:hypothetical protein